MKTDKEIAIKLKLKELITSIIQSEYCITADEIFITREIEKKIIPDIHNIDEQQLHRTAKEIATGIYNQICEINIHLAATESYNKNTGLVSWVSKFTHETVLSMLFDFLKRRNLQSKCFSCTLLYEALSLNNSQNHGKAETRFITITIKTLLTFGFQENDIAVLKVLTIKNFTKTYQSQDTTELLEQLKKYKSDDSITFNLHTKDVFKSLYVKFLFNIEDRQFKYNCFKEPVNIPLLEMIEYKKISLPDSVRAIAINAKSEIHKRFYQFLRSNVIKTTEQMVKKLILLELDFSTENIKDNAVHFFSEEHFKLACKFHNDLLEEKFKKLINLCPEKQDNQHENSQYQQLIVFIINFAMTNSIDFDAAVNHDDIMFLKTLYATNPQDIGCISDDDLDATNYGIIFDIKTIITAYTSKKANNQFYKRLLHLYRLPNALLKATLLIAKEHIHTGRVRKLPSSCKISERNSNTYNNNSLINNHQPVSINEINTLYIQILNPRFMSISDFKERLNLLINAGCSLKDCDIFSKSILHMLILHEREDLIEELLLFNKNISSSQQLDFNQIYTDQYEETVCRFTALHLAILTFRSAQIIALMLSEGCNPNSVDHRGMTALHYAVILGRAEIIDLLYRSGANPTVKDNRHLSPLAYLDDYNILHIVSSSPPSSFYQAIMHIGKSISFEYNRSVSATNNHLLLEPDQNIYFGYTDSNPDEKSATDTILFPMKYHHYYDEHHQYTENFKELYSALHQLQCTDEQRKYMLKQISKLDVESLIDFIIYERSKLNKLFKKINYNATEFFTTIAKQQKCYCNFNNATTAKLFEYPASVVRYSHKGIILIEIQRQTGKYNFTLTTSDKTMENSLAKELESFSPQKHAEKFHINQLSKSQFSNILDAIIKATKQALLPSNNGFYHRPTIEKSLNALTETAEKEMTNAEQYYPNIFDLD